MIGTVGVLLAAKDATLLTEVRPILEALVAARFRIGNVLMDDALSKANEGGRP